MKFKSIKNKLNTSLTYKLFIFGTLSLIILIFSILWISNFFSIQEYNKEVVRNNKSTMHVASQYFDETMNRYDDILYSMLFDSQFIASLYEQETESENFSNQSYIISKLFNINNIDTEIIDGVSVYTEWDNRVIEIPYHSSNINFQYPEAHSVNTEELGFYRDGYILRRKVNDFLTGNYIATVSIYINWYSMNTAFSLFDGNDSDLYVILNNTPVYPVDAELDNNIQEVISKIEIEEEINFIVAETTDNFTFYSQVTEDIYLLNRFEKNLTGGLNRSFIDLSIYIILVAITVYLLIIIYFNYSFIRPIRHLTSQMSKVKYGGLTQIKFNDYSNKKDEIYKLNNNFQSMMNQIKYMVDRKYKYDMYTKQIQFQSLQSKINPHFLRNTLQVIGNHALNNEGESTYELIKSLSNMFNYNLYDEKASTLFGEFENIKEYLYIQKARFPNKLLIDLYCDPDVENVAIPILTLQPLIENSFQHGFVTKKGMWKLKVSIEKVFDEILVTVSDNGIGIEEERLKELRIKLDERSTGYYKDSIGIKNVDERLKIIHGNENGLIVENKEDGGVQINFTIPID